MGRVQDKVVVVTGAGSGIGEATALLLAREGAIVAVTDVNDVHGESVAQRIKKTGAKAQYWHLDTSKADQAEKVMAEVAKTFGRIDALVNNAGIAGAAPATLETTEEEWDKVLNVNAKGVFLCTKYALPYLQKRGGSIVNISSIYGLIGSPDAYAYHASKGAVRLMTKTDAITYAKDKIRVNSVHPGFIDTPMLQEAIDIIPGGVATIAQMHPIGRMGEAIEIAYGILFLVSDESSFMTGSELVIDGGYTAR